LFIRRAPRVVVREMTFIRIRCVTGHRRNGRRTRHDVIHLDCFRDDPDLLLAFQ
jgi:hypothetical protein